MRIDWEMFLSRLEKYPVGTHEILPACPKDRIQAIQVEYGQMPSELVSMLRHFNGAQLFNKTCHMISIFPVSTIPPLPPLRWSPAWQIENYTSRWRSCGSGRNEWAIAMMNYGGLILLDPAGNTKEWDTAEGNWIGRNLTLYDWIEDLFTQGDKYLAEP
jgi:hypothetical protein